MSDFELYDCDSCGREFTAGEDESFLGDLNDTGECNPFMSLTKLCGTCYADYLENKED